jgi:hypothetical protein
VEQYRRDPVVEGGVESCAQVPVSLRAGGSGAGELVSDPERGPPRAVREKQHAYGVTAKGDRRVSAPADKIIALAED